MSGSPLLAIPLPLTLSATLLQLSDYLSPCRRPSVSLSPSTPNGKLNNNKTRQETAPSCPVFCFCLCLFLLANCFSTFNPPTTPQPPFYSSFFFFFGPFWKEIEWFLGCSSTYNQNNMSTCTMVKTHQLKNIKKKNIYIHYKILSNIKCNFLEILKITTEFK